MTIAGVSTDVVKRPIEFWFEFGSTYSYLSVMRIEKLAQQIGVEIAWKPILLGPIFQKLGWKSSPFLEQKLKLDYMWRDLERQCEKFGLQWLRPSVFPRVAVLPLRVALACAEEPWIGDFCRGVMTQHFSEDKDIGQRDNVLKVLNELSLPGNEIIERAEGDENKLKLRRQTEKALELGVFGGPMFFVGTEMFWGNDRLEDALAVASGRLQCHSTRVQ